MHIFKINYSKMVYQKFKGLLHNLVDTRYEVQTIKYDKLRIKQLTKNSLDYPTTKLHHTHH